MIVSAHTLPASHLSQARRMPVSHDHRSRDLCLWAVIEVYLLKRGYRPERRLKHLPVQAKLREAGVRPSNVSEQPFGQ
jgi:hypothetical protein